MKRTLYLLITTLILASCAGKKPDTKNTEQLAKLKQQRADLDTKIQKLEAETKDTSNQKTTPVTVQEIQPGDFTAYVQVQSQITGDENVFAYPQASGTITRVLVQPGQHVSQGQVLATLDAADLDQRILGEDVQVTLKKTLYDKQQRLWEQNIGTQVQLLQAKANYESELKTKSALVAQRNMYTIKSPISGTVDMMNLKLGDMAVPGASNIRIVSLDKLKAEANLGENYLGKVQAGNPVILQFPDLNDSIKTKLTYVSKGVDPISRAFLVQVRLGNNDKLHPNMSCIMKIANYENGHAIVVPVSIIQKTSEGDMLYVANGSTAKAVIVQTGRISNGQVEVLSGLNAGDKIITEGFEELDNGASITVQ